MTPTFLNIADAASPSVTHAEAATPRLIEVPMSNTEKYNTAFIETFRVAEADLPTMQYQAVVAWDSVGHMQLMATLEESFGIELAIDDIIDFSSYEKGKQILGKYQVSI
jgi:acyl carrier protein